MQRHALAVLCLCSVFLGQVRGQKTTAEPVQIVSGTILIFHLQTRLSPGAGNETDILPKGTLLKVKLLNTVDSNVDRDGSEFRGEVVASVLSGNEIVLHSESEVRGLLALLRSKSHPEGFRYELLITRISDHGKSYDLTASLSPSFNDGATPEPLNPKTEPLKRTEVTAPAGGKLLVQTSN
jgi:hypothetical protein